MIEPATHFRDFRRVAVVGGGVIGISWSALFLAHDLEVVISDPRPDIEKLVVDGLAEIRPTLDALGYDTSRLTTKLSFVAEIADAVSEVDVVQENAPEQLDVKQSIWTAVEGAAPSHALFATSTSSIPATKIAAAMKHPERLIVGHPFNPPHLVPLVEVVPGERTSAETIELARSFYLSVSKRPLVLGKEIPGFVANRLQSALFRECIYLVEQGVVTEQELDDVVTSSIGMRWAVTGPFQTFHLGGGPGGFPDFLTHFGEMMEGMWPALGSPALDAHTVALLSQQATNFGATVQELAAKRDAGQIALMRALGETPSH